MKAEIASVVELQEDLGLDVLVHGEAERNDMVQYFAEQLDGFAVTVNGWVQSYGSRCTRPSILWGDVARPAPMTVRWAEYAQSLTDQAGQGHAHRTGDDPRVVVRPRRPAARRDRQPGRPGPARRDRRPRGRRHRHHPGRRARPARAAPAAQRRPGRVPRLVGELLPARHRGRQGRHPDPHAPVLLRVRRGHRRDRRPRRRRHLDRGGPLAHGGPARRSRRTATSAGSARACTTSTPRASPRTEEVTELLTLARRPSIPALLWVNPDCGLKTRGYAETVACLEHLVAATKAVR